MVGNILIKLSFLSYLRKAKTQLKFLKSKRMALSVHRPAVTDPGGSSGLSVVEFFTEKLKTSNVVLVPPTFEQSGDPNKLLGEEAEKKVIDSIRKCGRDIPGIQVICFNGVRVISGSPSIRAL